MRVSELALEHPLLLLLDQVAVERLRRPLVEMIHLQLRSSPPMIVDCLAMTWPPSSRMKAAAGMPSNSSSATSRLAAHSSITGRAPLALESASLTRVRRSAENPGQTGSIRRRWGCGRRRFRATRINVRRRFGRNSSQLPAVLFIGRGLTSGVHNLRHNICGQLAMSPILMPGRPIPSPASRHAGGGIVPRSSSHS